MNLRIRIIFIRLKIKFDKNLIKKFNGYFRDYLLTNFGELIPILGWLNDPIFYQRLLNILHIISIGFLIEILKLAHPE